MIFDKKRPIIAVDVETTGLSPNKDRVVEVAAVKYIEGKEIEIFHTLVHPSRVIPQVVQKVHGISDEMVKNSPKFADIAESLALFLRDGSLLGHNIMFDYGFIFHECKRADVTFINEYPLLDTYQIAKMRLPSLPSYRLIALKETLGIGLGQTHRALDDVRDCKAVYDILMSEEEIQLETPALPNVPEHLQIIVDAIIKKRDIFIYYTDSKNNLTTRHIRPIAIYGDTLKAFCYLRQDERHFKLDKISLKA